MHDIKLIEENFSFFLQGLKRRNIDVDEQFLRALLEKRKDLVRRLQSYQAERNALSGEIAQAMRGGFSSSVSSLKAKVVNLKEVMQAVELEEREASAVLQSFLSGLPNLPLKEVPDGQGADENVEVLRFRDPPVFSFAPRPHFELGETLKMMDFATASQISGARFVLLKGDLARLERALGQFMLDVHTQKHGYLEVNPPFLVKESSVYGVGQLPKFAEDLFCTTNGHWLISTAEVPLTNIAREKIFSFSDLPLRFTALTPCFRSEAGAAGRDTRGMIRQHQFFKVELVSLTTKEAARSEFDRMVGCARFILEALGLPYRVMALCTGDMGFSAAMTYDLEVWLPSENTYREISSCSLFGDFQARRMNARYRAEKKQGQKIGDVSFLQSLNGSALAVGRTLIAVMENYQTSDGCIEIPEVLRPYMGGKESISLL